MYWIKIMSTYFNHPRNDVKNIYSLLTQSHVENSLVK